MALLNRMDGSWDGAGDLPLAAWLDLLAPEGIVNVDCGAAHEAALKSALLFGGFVNITSVACEGATGQVRVAAAKPAWQVGAAAKLGARLGGALKPAAAVAVPAPAGKRVVLSGLGGGVMGDDAEDDIVDEDDLMGDDVVLPAAPAGGGCSTKRRACADCSCGRAEIEASGDQAAADAMPADTSACGNCSKVKKR
jgi:hypothetical protein